MKRSIMRMYSKRNKCLKEAGYDNYWEYLKSDHWKSVKVRASSSVSLGGKMRKCHVCETKDLLCLHHKSYKSVGKENLNHLIWLCRECHERVHKVVNKKGVGIWNIAKHIRRKHRRELGNRERKPSRN